jgi:thiamine pyrophosphokinase
MPAEESHTIFLKTLLGKPEEVFVMPARLRVAIFANGVFNERTFSREQLSDADLVIAADGGARHCARLQIEPDILIGDFDSLGPAALAAYEKSGVTIIRYPDRKDFTDLELALLHAKKMGATHIQILGALGARWDQSLANVLLLASSHFREMDIQIIEPDQEIMLLQGGRHYEIAGEPGDTVSLLPLNADVQGVTTAGLEYPLSDELLEFGATRGISNVMLSRSFAIDIQTGHLLCVLTHRSGQEAPDSSG